MHLRAALPLLALPLVVLAASAPAASAAGGAPAAASAAPKVVIFNLYPSPLVRPKRVFFQADAGPFLDKLQWAGWGSATTTGTGVWTLDCSNGGGSCVPGDPDLTTYPARYVLGDLAPCPRFGPTAQSYRSGHVEIDRDGKTVTEPFASDYDFCATPPTKAAAKTAITAYVRRHQHVTVVSVPKCRASGDVDLECRAYWTKGGKKRNRNFDVSRGMTGPIHVFPLGD